MMNFRQLPAVLAIAFLAACGATVNFGIDIVFPDQAARDATVDLRVVAVEPGADADCLALLDGEAAPGDAGYTIEQEVELSMAGGGDASALQQVGPGRRLFYAEAMGGSGDVLLRGCSAVEAGGEGPESVEIRLEWVDVCQQTNGGLEICDNLDNDCDGSTDEGDASSLCPQPANAEAVACTAGQCEFACLGAWQNVNGDWSDGCECRPSREGVEYCDGLDNDCDGETDEAAEGEAACIGCSDDTDCEDPLWCITGTCVDGTCQVTFIEDGMGCDDGDLCTEGDVCVEGQCVGQAKDCADEIECTEDLCLPDGSCSNELADDFCYIGETCIPRDQVMEPGSCLVCNPDVAELSWSILPTGSSCDDGLWCTGTETCDNAGNCLHEEVPCQEVCMGECDEEGQQCLPEQGGTPCPDEFACTVNEECDGMGNCEVQIDDTVCEPYHPYVAQCSPECASDASGCIVPPPSVNVSCPSGDQPGDQPLVCTVQVQGAPEMTPCLTCRVLGPSGGPQIIWEEDFSGCSGPLEDGWNDWVVESAPPDCAPMSCGQGPSAGDVFSSSQMILGHSVDLGQSVTHAELCFSAGSTQTGPYPDFAAFQVLMDTQQGGSFDDIFQWGSSNPDCFLECVTLEEYDGRALGNPMVSFIFYAEAFSFLAFTLDRVWVEADVAPDLSDVVSVGELLSEDGTTYTVELNDLSGGGQGGFLHCSFDGGGGFGMDSFQFSAP